MRNSFPHPVSPVAGMKLRLCLASPYDARIQRAKAVGVSARPELVVWNGTPCSYGISTPYPYGKDSLSLAILVVSNEARRMHAPNVSVAGRD